MRSFEKQMFFGEAPYEGGPSFPSTSEVRSGSRQPLTLSAQCPGCPQKQPNDGHSGRPRSTARPSFRLV